MTSTTASDRHAGALALAAGAGLVAFPFLSPLVAGPSANAWQLLASWTCVGFLALQCRCALPSRSLTLWLGVVALSIMLAPAGAAALKFSAVAATAVVALAACIGAGWVRRPADPASMTPPTALAWGLLVAGLGSAVLGLLQYYGHAQALVPWTTAPELGQAYGNLRQRNQFATLIGMALVAGLALYGGWTPRQRVACLPAALLLLLAAAASTSRTGLLQWLLISGVAAFLARRERHATGRREADAPGSGMPAPLRPFRLPHPALLLALVPAYFIVAWMLPMLAGPDVEDMLRRLREGAPEGHSRLLLWHNVLELIGQHPWRGWGWGELSFAHYTHPYAGPRFVEILDNAHNLPLHLAVELGIPAAVAICGGFTWLVLAVSPWRERDPLRLTAWGVLGAIVLHSLLEYPLWYGPFQLVFGLCLGLLWPGRTATISTAGAPQQRCPWLTAHAGSVAAAVLLAGVAYASWDYTRISQIYLAREHRLPTWRDDTARQLQASWLFARQVQFAELSLMPVDRANAADVHARALRALHFSPEPRVIVKLIESAALLGRNDEAMAQAVQLRRAFPEDYIRWLAGNLPDAKAD